MASDERIQETTGIEPDGALDRGPFIDEEEAEGHQLRVAEGDDPGPDPAERRPGDPDTARYSDRNLKVAIVPVAW